MSVKLSTMEQIINDKIDSALDKSDLQPILDYVPLHKLQAALKQIINDPISEIDKQSIIIKITSIDITLSQDIIRHILTFLGLHLRHAKAVNKRWY